MIGVPQVADFMSHHIIDAPRRHVNEIRIQRDFSISVGASPTFAHFENPHGGFGEFVFGAPWRPQLDSLIKLLRSPVAKPLIEKAADCQ